MLKEEPVCNYRGHSGRLLCVQWSTVHPDLVWTGGDDFTLHEWAVSKQEHVTPPKSMYTFIFNISIYTSRADPELNVY